jgi:hypothetical protein
MDIIIYTTEDDERKALLFPSKFREGPVVSIGYIDDNFFTEFTDYL